LSRRIPPCHFHCAPGVSAHVLACKLDSLARVARRDRRKDFVNIPSRLKMARRERGECLALVPRGNRTSCARRNAPHATRPPRRPFLRGTADFVDLGPLPDACEPPPERRHLLRRAEPMLTARSVEVHGRRGCPAGAQQRACYRLAAPARRRRRPLSRRPRNSTPSFGFPAFGFGYFSLSSQSSLHRSLTLLICYRSPVAYLALDEVYHPILCSSPNEHDS